MAGWNGDVPTERSVGDIDRGIRFVNLRHLTAIVGMRLQMMLNRFRKSGQANWIITGILAALARLCSFGSFVFAVGWGNFLIAKLEPFYVIYVWDAVVMLFLLTWNIGLINELQRSEMLSLKNLLHLPISLSSAFFLNYTSSPASLTVLLCLPTMYGLCLASVLQFGIKSLVTYRIWMSLRTRVLVVHYRWLATSYGGDYRLNKIPMSALVGPDGSKYAYPREVFVNLVDRMASD